MKQGRPQPALGLFDAVCIMVGIIIGVGIFETPPWIAAELSGYWEVMGIWLLGGVLSLCGALCYAELASAYPQEGGDYHYLRRAFGDRVGYLFAWSQVAIVRPGSIAAMAFPFGRYLAAYWLPLSGTALAGHEPVVFAVLAVAVLTVMNCLKVELGKDVQDVLTVSKYLGLASIAAIALITPALPSAALPPKTSGSAGLALILVLFTYGGWNEIAYVAAEVRDIQRNALRGLLWCLTLVTAIYLCVNAAFLSVLGHAQLADSKAVALDVVSGTLPASGGALISALICVSALGAVNGMIFTGARISYALGADQRLFKKLGVWNDRSGTPVAALLVQGVVSIVIILLTGSFSATVIYTTTVVWLFFTASGAALMVLRVRDAVAVRPYRVPLYPIIPLIYCASSLMVSVSALRYDVYGSLISVIVMLAGLLFYRRAATR